MSRIYFHSQTDTAELRGSERAHMGVFCNDVAIGLLGLHDTRTIDQLRTLIAPDHYMHKVDMQDVGWIARWAETYRTAFVGWRHYRQGSHGRR